MLTRWNFSKAFISQLGTVRGKYLILLCLGLIVKSPLSKSRCLQMSERRQAWVPHQHNFTPIALRVTIMLLSTKNVIEKFSRRQFVQDMKEFRKDYDDDFVKAITGRGEYKMKYSHLELSTDQWFSMTLK